MSRYTIHSRLNLLIGAILMLALLVNMVWTLLSAGPRIRAENDSMLNFARQDVERTLFEIQGSADPQRDLAKVAQRLAGIRHVQIFLVGMEDSAPLPQAVFPQGAIPTTHMADGYLQRFLRLIYNQTDRVEIPAVIGGVRHGKVVLVTDPSDELAEIAETLTATALGGIVLLVGMFALLSNAVSQSLKPIGRLSGALAAMQQGDFAVRLPNSGPPDFAGINSAFNELAGTLAQTRAENRRLAEQLIGLEDQERRELAAELHDEFGPYLFAIRATATSLLSSAQLRPGDDGAQRIELCRALLAHTEAVQMVNRRVLQRLRPPALAEIGLDPALQGLIAHWHQSHPDVIIETSIILPDGRLPDVVELTVYRVVQEGLTNAFRHASASLIEIEISTTEASKTGWGSLTIVVADNGSGDAEAVKPGFGLSGMRDRVLALGGTITLEARLQGPGLVLEIELPLDRLGGAVGGRALGQRFDSGL